MDKYLLYPQIQSIIDNIHQHSTLSIIVPPSSGQDILLPYFLSRSFDNILVSLDSDTAIHSLYTFFQNIDSSFPVGYLLSTQEKINYGKKGVMLTHVKEVANLFLHSIKNGICSSLGDYDLIIFLDVEAFTIEKYIIFNIWKICFSSQKINLTFEEKLMLNKEEMALIPKDGLTNRGKIPHLLLCGSSIPLGLVYETYLLNFSEIPRYNTLIKYLDEDVYFEQSDYSSILANIAAIYFKLIKKPGDFLILIPEGEKTIELQQQLISLRLTWNIVNLNDGEIPPVDVKVRRVILCDWKNKSLINNQEIILIIDSCFTSVGLHKFSYIDIQDLESHLSLLGVNYPCILHRMISQSRFNKIVSQTQDISGSRIPFNRQKLSKINFALDPNFDRWILKMMLDNIDPSTLFLNNDLHPLATPINPILRYYRIIQLKMVDEIHHKPTELGKFAQHLPLSLENGYLLYQLIQSNLSFPLSILLVSFIEVKFKFGKISHLPNESDIEFRKRLKDYQNTHFSQFRQKSDIETCLSIWFNMNDSLNGKLNKSRIYGWAKSSGVIANDLLQVYYLRDVLTRQVQSYFSSTRTKLNVDQRPDVFFIKLREILPSILSYSIMYYFPEHGYYMDYLTKKTYVKSYYSVSDTFSQNPSYLIALTVSENKNMGIIDLSLPIEKPSQLPIEVISHLPILPQTSKSEISWESETKLIRSLEILEGDLSIDETNIPRLYDISNLPYDQEKKVLVSLAILSSPIREIIIPEEKTGEEEKTRIKDVLSSFH